MPIKCLGLIVFVLLTGGAIFALQGPVSTVEPLPEPVSTVEPLPGYIKQYQNKQPPVLTASGRQVHLINNPDAKAVSFAQLKSFIREDDTSEKPYSSIIQCADFAEQLHNNAERAGIRAAFVIVDFAGEEIGHALNAFITTDRGLVYIDCTGKRLQFNFLRTATKEDESKDMLLPDVPRPGEYDKVAYIEKGKQYGVINIDKAESLDYGFYVEYTQELQKLDSMIDDFNNEVDAFNRALGGRTTLEEPEYSKFKTWEAKINEKKRTILELIDKLGVPFEPLGVVEAVEIYW